MESAGPVSVGTWNPSGNWFVFTGDGGTTAANRSWYSSGLAKVGV